VRLLGLLVGFVIMPRHHISQILIDVGVLRQHRHDGEVIVASWTEGPEPLHIWDCHNPLILAKAIMPMSVVPNKTRLAGSGTAADASMGA
jgi:hypothetical protein